MRKLFLLSGLALCLALSAQENKNGKSGSEKVTFAVNMHCDNCKAKIEKNISWEKGVKDLTVDLGKKTITIVYNPQKTTEDKLKKAVEKLGYTCERTD